MTSPVSNSFFTFDKPEFDGVSDRLLQGVKESYGEEVLQTVSNQAEVYKQEMVQLAGLMMPELREVLARQRREYGIYEGKFVAQFPVEQKAANIDDAPTHNREGERDHGRIDYRLHKSARLSAVSRQHILQRGQEFRDGETSSFHSYQQVARDKRELDLCWSKQMETKMKKCSDEKREIALQQEQKKLGLLEEKGGPFTSAEQVETFPESPLDEKDKKKKK